MSADPTLTIDEIISTGDEQEAIVMGGANGEMACTFPRVSFICQFINNP